MARAAFVVCALACTLASGFAPRAPAPRRAAATAARAATPASDFVNLDTAAADRLAGKVSGAMEAVEAVTDRSPGVEKVGVSKTYALKAATTKETKAASQPKASKGEIKASVPPPPAARLRDRLSSRLPVASSLNSDRTTAQRAPRSRPALA